MMMRPTQYLHRLAQVTCGLAALTLATGTLFGLPGAVVARQARMISSRSTGSGARLDSIDSHALHACIDSDPQGKIPEIVVGPDSTSSKRNPPPTALALADKPSLARPRAEGFVLLFASLAPPARPLISALSRGPPAL